MTVQMSATAFELTTHELKAAQAAVRGDPVDLDALSSLLSATSDNTQSLLEHLRDFPVLDRIVLTCLIARMKRLPPELVGQAEMDEAVQAYRLLRCPPAERTTLPDITLDELRWAAMALRRDPLGADALASFLGSTPAAARVVLDDLQEPGALDRIVTASLLARLKGQTIELTRLCAVVAAVLEKHAIKLRRSVGH